MANCAYCGADTDLHINNVPVCLQCDKDGEVLSIPQAKDKKTAEALETRRTKTTSGGS